MKIKNENGKKKKISGIFFNTAAAVLCSTLLLSCGMEETDTSVHKAEENAVDNISSTENPVDNSSDSSGISTESEINSSAGENQTYSSDSAGEVYTGPEINLVMVGDVLLHTPVAQSGLQEDGSYNFDTLFENVKDTLISADLALVNQEVIIGGKELGVSGYPSFNAPYELGDALANAGLDVILHATNHALDQGKKGLRNCISFWETNYPDIAVLGINESQEQQEEVYVYEKDGIRIAVLNYTYGTNGVAMPPDMPYAVNLLEENKVIADIEAARQQADFLIVCPHWGTEYSLTVSKDQEYFTTLFLEQGVDLVIGTHPHVIEPVEWVSDENGNKMLVYYSLGNFVNWTSSSGSGIADRMLGGMAQVTVGMEDSGEAFVVDYRVEPLVCHLTEGVNGVTVYPLSDYTEELAAENAITEQDSAFSLEYCYKLCEEVWGFIF